MVVRYDDFKTGLTYQDVYAMLWVDSDDSSTWARKSRGAVLRLWGKLKADMWAAATGGLTPDEEYIPLELDADGVPLASDDDYAELDIEALPPEAMEAPSVRVARPSAMGSNAAYALLSRAARPDVPGSRAPESHPAWLQMRQSNPTRAGPSAACSRGPFGQAKRCCRDSPDLQA